MSRSFPSEKLADNFTAVLGEAEQLLNDAAQETGEKARAMRHQVEEKLAKAKICMQDLESQLADRTRACARVTDDYVHAHPWQAAGIGAAFGLILGLLLAPRR